MLQVYRRSHDRSLPSLGAWIETERMVIVKDYVLRRSLHWERGLKQRLSMRIAHTGESLPSLGAWIETYRCSDNCITSKQGRSLHWERGLKHDHCMPLDVVCTGRSLHWERGLKHRQRLLRMRIQVSRSLHWERGLKRS